jgi:isoleucyl-tRNA synthetase
LALCREAGIESFDPVGPDGGFTASAGALAGMDVFAANPTIIRHLKERGQVVAHENYRHSYPHCWRCDNPLIYRTISSWYVKVTAFKETMCRENRQINWVPEHIGAGRFGRWLEGARDWAISRNRYWGSPIPVWRCDRCQAQFVPASLAELTRVSGQSIADLHRPHCDRIAFACSQAGCGGRMRRVPEVLDCWFESGAMPYAQVHYPFEDREGFEKSFPAAFIVEYVAQTRGWFYTLMVESAAVMGKHPFKNAICHGVILADDGRKMSKSLNNFPDPMAVVNRHGSDALRIYLLSSAVVRGADIRFSEKGVREAVRRYLIPLWNVFHFFSAYAALAKGYTPRSVTHRRRNANMADRHLLSELEVFKQGLAATVEAYDLGRCYAKILDFIETLSGWYIRNNRERFWVTEVNDTTPDAINAFDTLYTVLLELSAACAPFIPFTTEYLFRHLTGRSVHLEDWPAPVPERIDLALNREVRQVRALIEGGRSIREKKRLNLRQPLAYIRVWGVPEETLDRFASLVKQQLNVKGIRFESEADRFARKEIRLDAKALGPRLKGELKAVAALVAKGDCRETQDGSLMVGDHKIQRSDYSAHYSSLDEKEAAWSGAGLVLSLCLEISPELKLEGLARNLNRIVQDLRKRLDLAYDRRVTLGIEAEGGYGQSLAVHKEWLMVQTLADRIEEKAHQPQFEKADEDGRLKVQVMSVPE